MSQQGIELDNYEELTRTAVKTFWATRVGAAKKQGKGGAKDQGERAGVTGGKNMDGFVSLVAALAKANGLADADVHVDRRVLTLPGFFRPTKLWDVVVMSNERLVAALEFKSHVGPSFGNNFNNRAEEAIGTSHDLWTAFREGAFGDPFRDEPRTFAVNEPNTNDLFTTLHKYYIAEEEKEKRFGN